MFGNIDLLSATIQFSVIIGAITFHEAAHAWSANRLGDPTAKNLGRLSLNPIVHIDPMGTILVPLLLVVAGFPPFGWAKPVPINPHRFDDHRMGMMLSALAGPASNLLLAAVLGVLWQGLALLGIVGPAAGAAGELLAAFLATGVFLNVLLAFFNLIPVPPLDGSRVVPMFLPEDLARQWDHLERYGMLFFFVLIFVLPQLIGVSPLSWMVETLVDPVTRFFMGWIPLG